MSKSNAYQIELLRKTIIEEVFIQKEEERIIGHSGDEDWIMDFRKVLLIPHILDAVSSAFLDIATESDVHGKFQVGGIEVAAIPIISGIVMKSFELGNPVNGFFIRKSRKKTGLTHMIEGQVNEERVVLVDDILNSGGSFMRQIEVIESMGKKVSDVLSIVRFRDESFYTEFAKKGIRIWSLFSLDDFSQVLPVKNQSIGVATQTPHPYKPIWVFRSESPRYEHVVPKSAPLLSEGKLYFGSDNGTFWALDAKDGKVIWTHKVLFGEKGKYIFSSPCLFKDILFFGAYDGNLYALDKHTGRKKWVAYDADWIGSSPIVAEDLGMVYVGMEFGFWKKKGGVAAYDVHTGKRIWLSESGDYTHGSPSYSKRYRIVVCGSNDGIVYGLHAKTGKVLWTYNAGGEIKARCSFSLSEKYVAFGSFNNNFTVLETKTGKVVSAFSTLFGNYSTPAWKGDESIICTSLDKRIYHINAKTGELIWEFVTSARIFASPILHNGKVYFGNNSARLYVLDIANGKEVALFQATERITNALVFDEKDDIFYLPTFANEIFALKDSRKENEKR